MNVYTYSETRQRLSFMLDSAEKMGEVLIRRRDGSMFRLSSVVPIKSPLDIKGVDGGVSALDIVAAIREGRAGHDR
jgi:hypothetical protein